MGPEPLQAKGLSARDLPKRPPERYFSGLQSSVVFVRSSAGESIVPRIKSAKKQMRQTKARTAVNKGQRSQLRTAIKTVRGLTDPDARAKAFAEAEKLIDRAGQKRIIHPNAAARLKSRIKTR